MLYYSTVQAGEENCFISVLVPPKESERYIPCTRKSLIYHFDYLKLVKATIMPSSCSRAEWCLFAHFHICKHLIQLLQTVIVTCEKYQLGNFCAQDTP